VTGPADGDLKDQVSPKTAAALRAAMTRLFEGRPQRTDGRLTKENLYKEAQVSRATMNRAHAILVAWDAHLAAHGKTTPGEAQRDATIADLKKRLDMKTQECTLLEKKLKAAHTAIAALFHDNEALRQQLDKDASAVVTPLRPRGPRQRR
jgi:small-conductance mechanosensitive channel